ncbi:unnamed protein product [Cylicocyclus nassatus]|uniref:Uncharacterized protein n=1 Tax=Cylicocyclus nassatus TaxID=53992 RepID=A0AA36GJF2_CYLNA|nr:unnamed protein product [Cylicocyclus nassatus]
MIEQKPTIPDPVSLDMFSRGTRARGTHHILQNNLVYQPIMHSSTIYLLGLFILVLVVTSKKPEFPTEELCELYKEKCEKKLKKNNCKERKEECLVYAERGLNVTWNFCMFANNDDEKMCRERATVDYEVIKDVVMNDTFKYDFEK